MNTTDFRALLLQQPGLEAAVGPRIYPGRVPTEVWDSATLKPCIVYRTSGVERSRTFCGTIGLKADSMSVDCFARSYDAAFDLATIVKQAIDFTGEVGETSFVSVSLESELDLGDLEPGLYRRALTFTIWNRSAAV